MRSKGVNVVLALALAAGVLYGASVLGHAVTRESNEGIAGDSSLAQTTPATSSGQSGDHDAQIRVALFVVAGMVAIAVLLSAISAFIRRPRHPPRANPSRQRR